MKLNLKKNKKIGGFSLVEVILAGAVLTLGVVAVMGLLSSSLKFSLDAKNYYIAVLLAQEGVELARNIRDNNWADNNPSFSYFPAENQDNCRTNMGEIGTCNDNDNLKKLYLVNNFYKHSASGSGTPTKFSRKIGVDYESGGDIAVITSVVISGSSFPIGSINYENCNMASRCAFAKVALSKWGE